MMTLNEILPTVYQLPNPDKLKLLRLLAEDLDNSADDISPLEQNKVYFWLRLMNQREPRSFYWTS